MPNESMGQVIARLRKEKNLTQIQLADLLNVTDKAVSKWERDLSCPSLGTIQQLARVLEVSVEEIIQTGSNENIEDEKIKFGKKLKDLLPLLYKAVPLAMGVAVIVLSILKEIEPSSAYIMLGIAVFLLALDRLKEMKD